MFRDCTGCSACCEGNLLGIAHGNPFGPKPCVFLDGNQCVIYDTRPEVCAKYQCAWTQNLFDSIIRKPSESNLLISVEQRENKQFLKCVQIGNCAQDDVEYINNWAAAHNTYVEMVTNENTNNGVTESRKNNTNQ